MPGILDLFLNWSNLVSNSDILPADAIEESLLQVMEQNATTNVRTTMLLLKKGTMGLAECLTRLYIR